jgi:hypothetical protein
LIDKYRLYVGAAAMAAEFSTPDLYPWQNAVSSSL